jgi:hypothetical protein
MSHLSRREPLAVGAAAGGGLLIGWRVEARARVPAPASTSAVFTPNQWLRIGEDGRITLFVSQAEIRTRRCRCSWPRSIRVPRSEPSLAARRPGRRTAFVEGFSLHADTWLHENDVGGLERLCNYGARGPLSLERLSALLDGRLTYRMKRPSPTGQTHLGPSSS